MRHAKASWDVAAKRDLDRLLDPVGRREAIWMGQHLAGWGLVPELLLSSHAARAHETAGQIATETKYPQEAILIVPEIYEATGHDLVKVIQSLETTASTVMLVGHHPGLQEAVAILSGTALGDFPTAGLASIRFELASFAQVMPDSGDFERFEHPQGLAG